tara:strand:+ start:1100 stop:1585 length:486 start_codon:yes stop_codon:yes gene_type:complete
MLKTLNFKNYFRSAGFSMIELIVVIVLIGIFTTMAMTRTDTGLTTIREQIAIDQITNDIDLARSIAFARNETITIMFDKTQESYGVYSDSGIIIDFPFSDNNGNISLDNSYLKNVDLKEVNFGGSSNLQFQPLGDIVSGGTIELNTKTITIEPITGKWSVN